MYVDSEMKSRTEPKGLRVIISRIGPPVHTMDW